MTGASSRIEGIGRPRVEPSFLAEIVDRMISVPDAASIAAARDVSGVLGRRVGPSTGTNVWGAFGLLAEIVSAGRSGSWSHCWLMAATVTPTPTSVTSGSPAWDWNPPNRP